MIALYYTCLFFKDPRQWSKEDVKSWLLWTFQQFSIPMSLLDLDLWNMDGQTIMTYNEEDFKQRLPQVACLSHTRIF